MQTAIRNINQACAVHACCIYSGNMMIEKLSACQAVTEMGDQTCGTRALQLWATNTRNLRLRA